jgi:hypothetical protein
MEAAASVVQMEKAATNAEGGNADAIHPAQTEDHNHNEVDWELSENGLPEESTLSGSKAIMDDYPEDEATSKKTKKTNTGKGKKSNPKIKK